MTEKEKERECACDVYVGVRVCLRVSDGCVRVRMYIICVYVYI